MQRGGTNCKSKPTQNRDESPREFPRGPLPYGVTSSRVKSPGP